MDEFKDKVSVLLGITGVGKSSFINAITKKRFVKWEMVQILAHKK